MVAEDVVGSDIGMGEEEHSVVGRSCSVVSRKSRSTYDHRKDVVRNSVGVSVVAEECMSPGTIDVTSVAVVGVAVGVEGH